MAAVPTRLVPIVALVAMLAACSSPGGEDTGSGPALPIGASFPAVLTDDIVGDVATVRLPGRVYEVEVTRRKGQTDAVSADDAGYRPEAADGAALVAVAWRPQPAEGDAIALGAHGPEVSPTIAVRVGGETFPVGAMDEEGVHARWVAVPEAGTVGVAVGFDGVTRSVEDMTDGRPTFTGGSALLDGPPPGLHDPECPLPDEPEEPAQYVLGGCTLQVSDPFPYHRDLGWAEDGQGWVVVHLRVDPVVVGWDEPGPGGAVVDYEVEPQEVTVTLDGAGPTDLVAWEPDRPAGLQDDGTWEGDAVFSVAEDVTAYEVRFTRPSIARPEDPDEAAAEGTPAEIDGTYAATIPVTVG